MVECFDKYGNLKWDDRFKNLVVNTGLDDILDKYWKGSGYTAAFYVGLIDASPTIAAADTMASHAGWAELSAIYDEAGRQALTLGTVASQAVDNSASKAQFAINTDSQSIGGAFISTDATNLLPPNLVLSPRTNLRPNHNLSGSPVRHWLDRVGRRESPPPPLLQVVRVS